MSRHPSSKRITTAIRTLFAVLALVSLSACQSSPTGRNQIILVSDGEMNKLGAASFAQMKEKTPPSTNAEVVTYVECLSKPLLIAAGENPGNWEVQVFQDSSPNAFALPGRKIGVHTGMIELASTPDQLAAVIGHEIGHVQAKHGAERVSLSMASQTVQQVAAIAVEGTEYGSATMAAIGLGAQFGVLLPYSRTHESEADYIGLKIMAKAGFQPQEAVSLWQNMGKAGGQKPPEFMSTHPSDKTRIRELSASMAEANALYQQALAAGRTPNCIKPR